MGTQFLREGPRGVMAAVHELHDTFPKLLARYHGAHDCFPKLLASHHEAHDGLPQMLADFSEKMRGFTRNLQVGWAPKSFPAASAANRKRAVIC